VSYYLAAYVIFWAALFGYLVAMLRRQARLVARAESLVARFAAAPAGRDAGAKGGGTAAGGI
jgi:hypothetical protein